MRKKLDLPRPPANLTWPVSVETVKELVAPRFGVTVQQIDSDQRARAIVRPRWLAIWITHKVSGLSTGRLGRLFNRDHTTVLHALSSAEYLLRRDRAMNEAAQAVFDELAVRDACIPEAERVINEVVTEIGRGLIGMARREPEFTIRALNAIAGGRDMLKQFAASLSVAALLLPAAASAEPVISTVTFATACMPVDVMFNGLANIDQMVVAHGAVPDGSTLLVAAAPNGAWSLLLLAPDGTACLVSLGEDWRMALPGDGS